MLRRRHAERGANRRARSVRAHHEPRLDRARAGLDPRFGRVRAGGKLRDGRGRDHLQPWRTVEPVPERHPERRVFDGVAESLDALALGLDPRGAEAPALGHVHGTDRL